MIEATYTYVIEIFNVYKNFDNTIDRENYEDVSREVEKWLNSDAVESELTIPIQQETNPPSNKNYIFTFSMENEYGTNNTLLHASCDIQINDFNLHFGVHQVAQHIMQFLSKRGYTVTLKHCTTSFTLRS